MANPNHQHATSVPSADDSRGFASSMNPAAPDSLQDNLDYERMTSYFAKGYPPMETDMSTQFMPEYTQQLDAAARANASLSPEGSTQNWSLFETNVFDSPASETPSSAFPQTTPNPSQSPWSVSGGSVSSRHGSETQQYQRQEQQKSNVYAQKSSVELEPASWLSMPSIHNVVSQLSASRDGLEARPPTLFDDLPPLPSTTILSEILCLYFERLPCTIPIIHEAAFYRSASQPASLPPVYPFPGPTSPRGLSPALLYSMLACAARYHPIYEEQKDLVEKTFYERAKRLTLAVLDKPDMNTLKSLLHLTLFGVENTLWMASYMWLGNSVTLARFLGLYKEMAAIGGSDVPSHELIGGLAPQQIMAEESRRIWWWTRNYDASGSAASKRPQMISDGEYANQLLLPCPDSLFHATRYGLCPPSPVVPRTQTLQEFYSGCFAAEQVHSVIGPNGYIAALTALFNRVTRYRQQCNVVNILPFAPGPQDDVNELVREFGTYQGELDLWYQKLPEWVQTLDSGVKDPKDPLVGQGLCWEKQWIKETYEWGIALVIWHASAVTLHGPDYNMMAMGNQIATKLDKSGESKTPPHIAASFLTAARLDEVLTIWQNSTSFGVALEHASRGSALLEEMAYRCEPKRRRDTPFFGYCVCQLGLINLIAARQIALMQRDYPSSASDDPTSLSSTLKHRATMSINILQHQSRTFSASKTGMLLLHRVMTEVAGGEITMRVMDELASRGAAGAEGAGGFKEMVVRRSMGQTARQVIEEPGTCAGTMGMGGQKFGTLH
ncbi:hypothetical protein HKX48_000532 [Thoreauomyces humboldtii]|nr:hypothetical protein HKX48_000532 [Thoreauomyces humboldtii]